MERAAPACPRLDHVSLIGRREDVERLGFEVTPTGADPGHARVFLERTYLELVPPDDDGAGFAARGWFLRHHDLDEAADRLRQAGITATGASPYVGVDGSWLDVMIGVPGESAMPLLTRRTDLPGTKWPPPTAAHQNGMTGLAGVRLRMADPKPLLHVLSVLGLQGSEELELETSSQGPDGIVGLTFARPDGGTLRVQTNPAGPRP